MGPVLLPTLPMTAREQGTAWQDCTPLGVLRKVLRCEQGYKHTGVFPLVESIGKGSGSIPMTACWLQSTCSNYCCGGVFFFFFFVVVVLFVCFWGGGGGKWSASKSIAEEMRCWVTAM